MQGLLSVDANGVFCKAAGVYIDPWKPVDKAIITHAHSDHARWGMKHYLAHPLTAAVMRYRLGADISVEEVNYHEAVYINGVRFSFHPAGHIPGSSQIRVEHNGNVWVVSGDYKTVEDITCLPFEPIKCHTFITESTFGLPIYDWQTDDIEIARIHQWWQKNKEHGKTSVLLGYSLGKSQRVLAQLDPSMGQIYTHGAVENITEIFRQKGFYFPPTKKLTADVSKAHLPGNLIMAPPSVQGSVWLRKAEPYSIGICSGWMQIRGTKRRRNVDAGFAISDHADWKGLNEAVLATGAEKVYVTHGYSEIFSKWLLEKGIDAEPIRTEYEGELGEIQEGHSTQQPEEEV